MASRPPLPPLTSTPFSSVDGNGPSPLPTAAAAPPESPFSLSCVASRELEGAVAPVSVAGLAVPLLLPLPLLSISPVGRGVAGGDGGVTVPGGGGGTHVASARSTSERFCCGGSGCPVV